jgi:hypothetical protein
MFIDFLQILKDDWLKSIEKYTQVLNGVQGYCLQNLGSIPQMVTRYRASKQIPEMLTFQNFPDEMAFWTKIISKTGLSLFHTNCLVTIENSHVNLKGTIQILLHKICFIFIFKLNCYKKSWRWQQPVEYEYWMESDSFINIETEIDPASMNTWYWRCKLVTRHWSVFDVANTSYERHEMTCSQRLSRVQDHDLTTSFHVFTMWCLTCFPRRYNVILLTGLFLDWIEFIGSNPDENFSHLFFILCVIYFPRIFQY